MLRVIRAPRNLFHDVVRLASPLVEISSPSLQVATYQVTTATVTPGSPSIHSKRTLSSCTFAGPRIYRDLLKHVGPVSEVCYQSVRHAGHSHWQNIRHTKAAADSIKQKEASRIRRMIMLVVQEGGADPKFNRGLQRVLDQGRTLNIPMVSMNEAIKKAKDRKDAGSEILVEARGIAGSMMLIACYTDKSQRTRQEMSSIIKKFGGRVMDAGAAAHSFEQKGVVYAQPADPEKPPDLDQATELAIEVGAEDVLEGVDADQRNLLEFHCHPKELHQVCKALSEQTELVEVLESRFDYLPQVFMEVTEEQLQLAGELLDLLENHDDVLRVYDNIKPKSAS